VKKKPDRKIVVAVLVLMAGAAAAKGIEAQKAGKDPAYSGASTLWQQSQLR
jgi:hypothetical protein